MGTVDGGHFVSRSDVCLLPPKASAVAERVS